MKKLLSFVLVLVLSVPYYLIPSLAFAATPLFSDGFESSPDHFSNWTSHDADWNDIHDSHSGSFSAQVKNTSTANLTKNISTVGRKNITLSYWYKIPSALSSSDHVRVQWSVDGVSWNTVVDYNSTVSVSNWVMATHTLPSGANDNSGFRIRFSASSLEHDDDFRLDDVNIDSSPLNVVPVAQNITISTNEENATSSAMVAIDADIPAQPLTYSVVSNPTNGTLSAVNTSTGAFTYTPNANWSGTDSFTFKANDGTADSNTATVTIYVASVNDVPILTLNNGDTFTVDEGTNVTFGFSAVDNDGDILTYSLLSAPTGASLSGTTFSWTPTEDQGPGTYTFDVKVSDGNGGVDTKSVTINVNEVNVAPVANPLTVSTHQNTDVSASVVSTDSDIPANTLTHSILTQPVVSGASVVMNSDGSFTYTPATNYNGIDSFTYEVSDGNLSGSATVTVNVNNDAPALNAISDQVINELSNINFTILAIDDVLDTLTYSLLGSVPSGVTLDSGTGVFDWTPTEAQGPGVYNFTAQVSDGALIDSKTFQITVNEVNEIPATSGLSIITDEDNATSSAMVATDADIPVNTIAYATSSNPANGIVSVFDSATGAFTYTPNANWSGSDSFTFVVGDGIGTTTDNTVSITVNPVNDAPSITLLGNNPINLVVGDNFVDPGASSTDVEDGDISSGIVASGTVSTSTAGTYTITYTSTDSDESSTSTTRTVIVTDKPVENTQPLCTDGIDNDNDNLTDLSDPDCSAFIPAPTPTPTPTPTGGGNGPIVGSVGGQVLGASISPQGEVLGASCGVYMNKYLRLGSKKNDSDQVKKLQTFLNKELKINLPVTGYFGNMTEQAVRNFQIKYSNEVLKPWNLGAPTGLVYLSTLRQVNILECPDLTLELPPLVPWSQNPNI